MEGEAGGRCCGSSTDTKKEEEKKERGIGDGVVGGAYNSAVVLPGLLPISMSACRTPRPQQTRYLSFWRSSTISRGNNRIGRHVEIHCVSILYNKLINPCLWVLSGDVPQQTRKDGHGCGNVTIEPFSSMYLAIMSFFYTDARHGYSLLHLGKSAVTPRAPSSRLGTVQDLKGRADKGLIHLTVSLSEPGSLRSQRLRRVDQPGSASGG